LPTFSIESGAQIGDGKYAPFLLASNKYGIYSVNKNQLYARISAVKTSIKTIDVYYGIDLVENYSKNNNLFIQQLYGAVKFHSIHLKGGLKEDFYCNHDSILSIGGTLWSTNARPIPQIYLGIPEFTYVPFTKKFFEIKGGISHGWLGEKDQFVKNAYLHSKYLVGRFGPEKIKLQLGLYHVAQWGGTSPIDSIGKLPSSFKDFLTVFQVEGDNNSNLPYNEREGYLGNHLASYQAAIQVFTNSFNYTLNYQSFLEDKNGRIGIDWKNKPDMILGFSLKNKNSNSFFQQVLIEYIHTSQQSGDPLKSGNDNYYNNSIYKSGWTYKNMTIGTPLITSPEYFHGPMDWEYLKNNRVIALNSGLLTKIKDNLIMLRALYSLNYGTVNQPIDETKQFSLYSSYSTILKKMNN
jgi:hypothetical protein